MDKVYKGGEGMQRWRLYARMETVCKGKDYARQAGGAKTDAETATSTPGEEDENPQPR